MKSSVNVLLCALLAVVAPAHGEAETPMARVVKLIQDLKGKVEKDGKEEQASFDTYACWCEKTLERKASDITSSKELIEETEILISKLKGEIASHGAEIAQLTKDIAANLAGQKEATGMRNKENSDYAQERTESEQCIGALEAAIKVLTGAGTKKGFLDTSTHKAQLLSVAAGVRSVLALGAMSRVSSKNLDMVKDFVAKPEDFMAAHSGVSAAQVGQNPFGDYAPSPLRSKVSCKACMIPSLPISRKTMPTRLRARSHSKRSLQPRSPSIKRSRQPLRSRRQTLLRRPRV
jgi:hypothetical protein